MSTEQLDRTLAHLKRTLSAAEIDAAVEAIGELAAIGFAGAPERAAVLYRVCSRGALELARGGSVFEATRLVRALLPHFGAIDADQADRWRLASAAVDVAVAANDPELVVDIDRELLSPLDLDAASSDVVAALYNMACLHARFGHRDRCLRYAHLALERGGSADEMRGDPDFAAVATDPEFLALLARY